jgi:hypothetical protein
LEESNPGISFDGAEEKLFPAGLMAGNLAQTSWNFSGGHPAPSMLLSAFFFLRLSTQTFHAHESFMAHSNFNFFYTENILFSALIILIIINISIKGIYIYLA